MSDKNLIDVFSKKYSISQLEKRIRYPITNAMTDFHNNPEFLKSFDEPKFGFATLLCSKSDPKKLLYSLYSLLKVNVINKMNSRNYVGYVCEQRKFDDIFKQFDFKNSLITISTCEEIVSRMDQYYIDNRARIEQNGNNEFHEIDKKYYENILLFVFYEDFTLSSPSPSIQMNIYTVIPFRFRVFSGAGFYGNHPQPGLRKGRQPGAGVLQQTIKVV